MKTLFPIAPALLAFAAHLAPAQAGAQEDPMALITAVAGGDMATVVELLEQGANVNGQAETGYTALMRIRRATPNTATKRSVSTQTERH